MQSAAKGATIIVGAGKSGTSGLYAAIKAGLEHHVGHEVAGIFEPKTADEARASAARPLVAKMLLERLFKTDVSLLNDYDRRVLIIRDPRDVLVSRLLWQLISFSGFDSRRKIEEAIDLIRKKEDDPQSISLLDLYDAIGKIGAVSNWDRGAENFAFLPLRYLSGEFPDTKIVSYEDFILGKDNGLEAYLGYAPIYKTIPQPPFDLTFRDGSSGQWRDWFTPADHDRFVRPNIDKLKSLGYTDFEFSPNTTPIPRLNGSQYVEKRFSLVRPELFG